MFGAAPTWLVVTEVLVFMVGAVAFAVVLGLSRTPAWRQAMDRVDGTPGSAIAANSIVYCLANVAAGVLVLTGRPTGFGLLTLFTITTYLYPPLIIDDILAGDRRRAPLRGTPWRIVLAVVWLASLTLAAFVAGVYLDLWRVRLRSPFFNLTIGSLFIIAVAVALAAARVRARQPTARPPRPEARWVLRLFVVSAVLSVTLMITAGDIRTASYPFSLTMRMLPLAFLVAGAYADGRAAFYDLLVKRVALTLLAMSILAAAAALVEPVVGGVTSGLAALLVGILLGPLVLAFAWLGGTVSDWLDARWLGRRFTPGEAIEHLLSATRSASDRATLEARALAAIGEMFDADVRVCTTGDEAAPAMHVAVAPISDVLLLEASRRDESRAFYSEDLALVRSVARVLGLEFDRLTLERQRQAEAARALRAQVSPHFLFNALNAIGGSMHVDPHQAETAVEQLARVFRYTLRGATTEWVTLGEELEAVHGYLAVEQLRFGSRLQSAVDCDATLRAAVVPPLLVLTLAENAIKHGVADAIGDVRVEVAARRQDDSLVVEVVDTGDGLDRDWARATSSGGGFGLASVRERLRLACGDDASLQGTRDEARCETRFTITVPFATAAP